MVVCECERVCEGLRWVSQDHAFMGMGVNVVDVGMDRASQEIGGGVVSRRRN